MNHPHHYRQARYHGSAHKLSQLPTDSHIEVAFAGRSNAGKSTAINALCDQRRLARVSRTPGRTQMINFFNLSPHHYLVDLPGYGYAKVPESLKQHWQQVLATYLQTRASLQGLILIADVRREITSLDRQMIVWANSRSLPLHILLTKADKLKRGAAGNALQAVRKTLHQTGLDASVQLFSGQTSQGIDEACVILNRWFGIGT